MNLPDSYSNSPAKYTKHEQRERKEFDFELLFEHRKTDTA